MLIEHKVMAFVKCRKGLDVVGSFGLLQPLAYGLKLILKEPISPSSANFTDVGRSGSTLVPDQYNKG